jgi:hypothetical protein
MASLEIMISILVAGSVCGVIVQLIFVEVVEVVDLL